LRKRMAGRTRLLRLRCRCWLWCLCLPLLERLSLRSDREDDDDVVCDETEDERDLERERGIYELNELRRNKQGYVYMYICMTECILQLAVVVPEIKSSLNYLQ
jgi:hypothetical protein